MFSSRAAHLYFGQFAKGMLMAGALVGTTGMAATVGVTDNVSTFSTLESINSSIMSDPTYDQQTGQGADDFVGDGANGYYGFYYKFGQIDFGTGNGSEDAMVFRFRLNDLGLQQGTPKFTGNIRIGVDGDGDGNVDLFFGVSTTQAQAAEIVFQNPTGTAVDANTSPSTSSLGTSYGNTAGTSANFSYTEVTDGSAYYTNKPAQPNTDAFLTFAISFSTFKTYLEAQLAPGTVITLDSFLRFLAFSSTQGNAVNQDVYGLGSLSVTANADMRFDEGGGFTNYYSANGKVIPEPATVVQFSAFALSGLGVVCWRRRRARKDCATA
jgi:hypothetical protein